MKKGISILLILLVMMSCTVFATQLSATYEYDSISNGFYVSGVSDDDMTGDDITVEMYLGEECINTVMTQTFLHDGKQEFKTELMPLGVSTPSGEIVCKVYGAHGDNIAKTQIYNYNGIDTLYPILINISKALESKSFEKFMSVVLPHEGELGVDASKANSLGGAAKNVMEKYLSNFTFNLPNNIDTQENAENVFEQLITFRKQYAVMLLLGEFADISNSQQLISWYKKYSDILDMNNIKGIECFNDFYQKASYFEIFKEGISGIITVEAVKTKLIDTALMTVIYNSNATAVKKIFEGFSDKFLSSYSSRLSEIQKNSIYMSIAGEKYLNCAEAVLAYDAFAYSMLNSSADNQNSSNGGGNNSGSRDTVSVGMNMPSQNSDENTSVKEAFTDLETVPWAKEAILNLYEKKIIAGKKDGEFMPNDEITRGEFIKLLICSINMEPYNEEQFFIDIKADDWYAPYANSAYKAKITTGYFDGTFRANEKITRQDMAVMLYRALDVSSDEKIILKFTDKESINDYAKEAVSYFVKKEVINGMGDGNFAPMFNATRAQGAQMIYKAVK